MKMPNAGELLVGVPGNEHMAALLNEITRSEWLAARPRLQRQLDELRVPGG